MSNKDSSWFSLGNINKSKSGDAQAAQTLAKFTQEHKKDLKLSLKVNLRGKEEELLKKGSYIIFNFNDFEDKKDFVVGRAFVPVNKGSETEFISLGNITKSMKTPQSLVDEFLDIVRQTKINCKVYFNAKDDNGNFLDSVKIMNNDRLLISFNKTEKEPDFVLGRVLLNLENSK